MQQKSNSCHLTTQFDPHFVIRLNKRFLKNFEWCGYNISVFTTPNKVGGVTWCWRMCLNGSRSLAFYVQLTTYLALQWHKTRTAFELHPYWCGYNSVFTTPNKVGGVTWCWRMCLNGSRSLAFTFSSQLIWHSSGIKLDKIKLHLNCIHIDLRNHSTYTILN